MSWITALSCEPFELWQVQRDNPELTGQALISVREHRVLACSPLARAAGIEAGMSEAAARLRSQDLVVIEYDAASLAERWRQWLTDLYTVTSRIESLKMGRVLLQVDQADAQQLAEVYSVRAGRAASRELALLAALSALQGQARCIGEPRAFIDALPLYFLRGVGLSQQTLTRLLWLGYRTVGALSRWRDAQLRDFLGADYDRLAPYIRAGNPMTGTTHAVAPFQLPRTLKRVFVNDGLMDLCEPYQVEPVLDALCQALVVALGNQQARRLTLTAISHGLAFKATRLAKSAWGDYQSLKYHATLAYCLSGVSSLGISELHLELDELIRPSTQQGLWQCQDLQHTLAQITRRYPDSLYQIKTLNPYTEVPEERLVLVNLRTGKPKRQEVTCEAVAHSDWRRAQRPQSTHALLSAP